MSHSTVNAPISPTTNHESTLSGLFFELEPSKRVALDLLSAEVQAQVVDNNTKVSITQCFKSDATNDIASSFDLMYAFPLVEHCVVTSFACNINGNKVVSRFDNKNSATNLSATSGQADAGTENLFICNVGRIPSNSSITVSLTYHAGLSTDLSGQKLLVVPHQVVPKLSASSTSKQSEFKMNCSITMSASVQEVVCRSHPTSTRDLKMSNNNHRANINIAMPCKSLDKDLSIVIKTKESSQPRCLFEVNPTSGDVSCSLTLPCALVDIAASTELASEFVFILDCSASMSWNSITAELVTWEYNRDVKWKEYEKNKASKSALYKSCRSKFDTASRLMGLPRSADMLQVAYSQFEDVMPTTPIGGTAQTKCRAAFDDFVKEWLSYDVSPATDPVCLDYALWKTYKAQADIWKEKFNTASREKKLPPSRIESLKRAMQLILKSLPEQSKFQLIRFGDSYKALFSGSTAYNEQSLAEAADFVSNLSADMPGTALLKPLEFVLTNPSPLPRSVFVITDGAVPHVDLIHKCVASHAQDTRVFSIGIGSESSNFCQNLARAGNGECKILVTDVTASLVEMVQAAMQPCVTKISVDWGNTVSNGGLKQCPAAPPVVFPGTRNGTYAIKCTLPLAVIERLKSSQFVGDFDSGITVHATSSLGNNQPQHTKLSPSVVCYGDVIPPLAARARIDELERLHGSPSCSSGVAAHSSIRTEIEQLTNKYGVSSRETKMLFGSGKQQQVIQARTTAQQASSIINQPGESTVHKTSPASPQLASVATSSETKFQKIVGLHTAGGLWKLTAELISLVESINPKESARLRVVTATSDVIADIEASKVILEVLQTSFADRSSSYVLLTAKTQSSIARRLKAHEGNTQRKRARDGADDKLEQLKRQKRTSTEGSVQHKRLSHEIYQLEAAGECSLATPSPLKKRC